ERGCEFCVRRAVEVIPPINTGPSEEILRLKQLTGDADHRQFCSATYRILAPAFSVTFVFPTWISSKWEMFFPRPDAPKDPIYIGFKTKRRRSEKHVLSIDVARVIRAGEVFSGGQFRRERPLIARQSAHQLVQQ